MHDHREDREYICHHAKHRCTEETIENPEPTEDTSDIDQKISLIPGEIENTIDQRCYREHSRHMNQGMKYLICFQKGSRITPSEENHDIQEKRHER